MEYLKIMDTLDVEMCLMNVKMQRPDGQTTGLPHKPVDMVWMDIFIELEMNSYYV